MHLYPRRRSRFIIPYPAFELTYRWGVSARLYSKFRQTSWGTRERERKKSKKRMGRNKEKRETGSKKASYRSKVRKIRETDSTLRIGWPIPTPRVGLHPSFFSREHFMEENSTFATISQRSFRNPEQIYSWMAK